ncbi:MAG: 3',5'-cyclic-nucleotide phosphodiesterase [Nitrospirae bacterium]|nr:3',5'-cyclic-nucleotide phosphodiesterase [Nitrospirota bacterium]
MRIKVLGCSGAEFPGHNPPGFLLDSEILFDAGSLTNVLSAQRQQKIRNIFITHAHLDHIKGIPFLADNLIIRNRECNVTVLSIPSVIKTIRENLLNGSVWPDFTVIPEPRNGVLKFVGISEGRPLRLKGFTITPYNVNHSVPAVGYLVEDEKGKRFFYSGDTGPTADTWKKIGKKQIHCLIIEVSFPNRMEETALVTGHLTTRLLKEELSGITPSPEKIFITHSKPQYYGAIRGELGRLGMKNLRILRDGETITI